jgi:hypothetical protein
MNDEHLDIISALLDGEPVEPDALEQALDAPDGRRLLVEFVRLREAARAELPLPPSLVALRRRAPLWRRAVPLPAVAALLLIAWLTAWFVPRPAPEAPLGPPAPTRTLSYEPGVDWREWQP